MEVVIVAASLMCDGNEFENKRKRRKKRQFTPSGQMV